VNWSSAVRLLGRDGPEPAEEEAERDRDDAGVLQREPVEVHVAGNSDRLAPVTGFTPRPETTGEKNTRTTQEIRPP
jgi:hypothetical protein